MPLSFLGIPWYNNCKSNGKNGEPMEMREKRIFHIINLVLLGCAIGCLICYDLAGGLWLKGVTSGWFVLLGIVNLVYAWRKGLEKKSYLYFIVAGLFLGMCADVLLGVVFVLGILSFALGHICYLAAFYTRERFCLRDVLIILPIAAVSVVAVTGTPYIRIVDPMLRGMLIAYAVIIAGMLGKAVSNLSRRKSLAGWLMLLGSGMFWFSDLMLAFNMFGTGGALAGLLCTYTYWPAQNILAYAMYHYVNENEPKQAL